MAWNFYTRPRWALSEDEVAEAKTVLAFFRERFDLETFASRMNINKNTARKWWENGGSPNKASYIAIKRLKREIEMQEKVSD